MTNEIRGPYDPQQLIVPGYPGIAPPMGWVPPLGGVLNLIGVYDSKRRGWVGLPLEALTEALAVAEAKYSLDRIDERDTITAKIANGSEVGTRVTAGITVPAGEVWFLNRLVLISPAQSGINGEVVRVNVRVSSWKFPDARDGEEVSELGRTYLAQAVGTTAVDTETIDLPAQGQLGEELRLVGGDKVTLVATLTEENAQADLTATLKPFGRKVKRLVA